MKRYYSCKGNGLTSITPCPIIKGEMVAGFHCTGDCEYFEGMNIQEDYVNCKATTPPVSGGEGGKEGEK